MISEDLCPICGSTLSCVFFKKYCPNEDRHKDYAQTLTPFFTFGFVNLYYEDSWGFVSINQSDDPKLFNAFANIKQEKKIHRVAISETVEDALYKVNNLLQSVKSIPHILLALPDGFSVDQGKDGKTYVTWSGGQIYP